MFQRNEKVDSKTLKQKESWCTRNVASNPSLQPYDVFLRLG